MKEGPIIQTKAVVFLRARHLTAGGRNHDSEIRDIIGQRELCRQAAEKIDASIVKEYIEYGGTGPISARPVPRQMLADLSGLLGVRYVLVASFDRLARQSSDFTAIEMAVTSAGARLLNAADLQMTYLCNPGEFYFGACETESDPPLPEGRLE